MILFKKINDLRKYIDVQHQLKKSIGFVPTMGALHEGHLSLIRSSLSIADITVCSIFVNPTQFNDPTDFEKYPVTLEADIGLLEASGCQVLFLPSVKEIYPGGIPQSGHYDLGYLETVLEGRFRPGHFQGVCTVVDRLLGIVCPDHLFLGQKDYQQCMVIARLVELSGKTGEINIHICPTLREADGLAMSSRNRRLSSSQRQQSVAIYRVLTGIREGLRPGELKPLRLEAVGKLKEAGLAPEYIEIAEAGNLQILEEWDGASKLVALVAAFMGEVRLIDNILLN